LLDDSETGTEVSSRVIGNPGDNNYSPSCTSSIGSVSEAVDVVESVEVINAAEAVESVNAVNLFVDTSALSAEKNLQSALNLFAKHPRLFQRTTSGDDSEAGSKKSWATCTIVESIYDDIEAASDLLQVHPFCAVSAAVILEKRHKCAPLLEKEDYAPMIKFFV
jgi:hypothetical protein